MMCSLLGGSSRNKEFWDPVLDRCSRKLTRWKANYFSVGGRITLIEATLSNLQTYYFIIKIPQGVAADIGRPHNQFLWRSREVSKPHLNNWRTVTWGRKMQGWLWVGSSREI